MLDQDVFDKVSVHLLSQNCKAEIGWNCAYRGENGTSCAVGCLFPDEDYDEAMEGTTIGHIFCKQMDDDDRALQKALENNGIDESNKPLLKTLQWVHDDNEPEAWAKLLEEVRNDFSLE